MNSEELKTKLAKALETVEKRKKTIERHTKQAEKKFRLINEKNLELDRYKYCGSDDYWLICEYENKLDDIENAKEKLAEAERIAANWKEKLDLQIEKETEIAEKVPEAFKEAKKALVDSWVDYDIRCRDKMLKDRKEMEYKEFREKYRYSYEQSLKHTDEEFREIEEKEADGWLLNLYHRVVEKTGEITDCSRIHWGGKCLDGHIVGKKGKAVVETIDAGGYNIQRWHLRTLVK